MIDHADNYSSYIRVNPNVDNLQIDDVIIQSDDFYNNADAVYRRESASFKKLGLLNINIEYRIKQILRDHCGR
ncbi:MAG: hypothetical protein AABY15_07010 [Nanoarchaeota archaeon]